MKKERAKIVEDLMADFKKQFDQKVKEQGYTISDSMKFWMFQNYSFRLERLLENIMRRKNDIRI